MMTKAKVKTKPVEEKPAEKKPEPTQQELHLKNAQVHLSNAIANMTGIVISLNAAGASPTAVAIKEMIGDLTVTNTLIAAKLRN